MAARGTAWPGSHATIERNFVLTTSAVPTAASAVRPSEHVWFLGHAYADAAKRHYAHDHHDELGFSGWTAAVATAAVSGTSIPASATAASTATSAVAAGTAAPTPASSTWSLSAAAAVPRPEGSADV